MDDELKRRELTDRQVADDYSLRLADVIEHSDDAIVTEDLDGVITSWNPAAERMYGYAASDVVGQHARLIVPEAREAEEAEVLRQVRLGQRAGSFDTVRRHHNGSLIDVALSVSPIRDGSGAIVGASTMARDITLRHRLASRDHFLIQLDDTLRPLTDSSDIALAAATALGRHLRVNRCAYAPVEDDQDTFLLTGNYCAGVNSIVGRYTFRQFSEECLRLMLAGQPFVISDTSLDARVAEAERPAYIANEIAALICVPISKAGRFVASMAVHSATPRAWTVDEVELLQRVADRSWESIERARATQTLSDSEQQFRAMANSIPNLAWMARPDGWIYWYNEQWYAYTGTTLEDMSGWRWESVHDPKMLPTVKERWLRSITEGQPFEMVFPIRGADGKFRRFLTRVNPVRDARGTVVHWFGTNTDVENERRATELNDELRQREGMAREEAERQKRLAEAANRAKDEFLAMLGHELRNPLSPILTALQLMNLRGSDGTAFERQIIERQVRHMTRLVDDLLDVSRIARGKVSLNREVVEISEVITKAIELTSPLLEQRQHTVALETPKDGLAVDGDTTRLGQVLSNLVANAAKYTEPGGQILVRAALDADAVVVTVRDNGIGIAPEVLPHVFELFVQGRQTIDRTSGGLGLGLTIARNLTEAHGGQISAHSGGVGLGSEFVVRLPRVTSLHTRPTPMADAAHAMLGRPSMAHVRVLVVDDNADAAIVLSAALIARGFTVATAPDALSALEVAAQFAPTAAILDLGLPVINGYELAVRLKAVPGLEDISLIALTGYGQEADLRRTQEAGFAVHLIKPATLVAIEGALLSVHQPSSRSGNARTVMPSESPNS